jgi:RHH-type proline utilization regulon transcriptional repressor/proline dehydrogenase/delta 1-pyrroline-5-carboxylate dehydrogenase
MYPSASALPPPVQQLRTAIAPYYRADEATVIAERTEQAKLDPILSERVRTRATQLIAGMRLKMENGGRIEQFLQEYQLSTREGVTLMCLAEALLRIPDTETADALIRDKLGGADWEAHLGKSDSVLVNASTWALMLTGRVVNLDKPVVQKSGLVSDLLGKLVARSGEPVIRAAIRTAMKILGKQFVMGRTIEEALERAIPAEKEGYRHSYDMLGESARTRADAERYFNAYESAIRSIGKAVAGRPMIDAPNISVKLSALHPRYEVAQADQVMRDLVPALLKLCQTAKEVGIGLMVDAEESERLEISLDIFTEISGHPSLKGWDGLGLAVQAYQKRALPALQYLDAMAATHRRKLLVRLVKGAYWDSEVKRAQERGLPGYAVFTRKAGTDVSYIACAKFMLASKNFYPAFATHNAMTLAAILELAGNRTDFEFQRLHGMGEALYQGVVGPKALNRPCRVYAPVGSHEDLLAYLVRRLLENGANTSFVNQVAKAGAPIESLTQDPVAYMSALSEKAHPRIPLPANLYGPERLNSSGIDLSDPLQTDPLMVDLAREWQKATFARPLVGGNDVTGKEVQILDPADHNRSPGAVVEATPQDAREAITLALAAQHDWSNLGAEARAECLLKAADAMESQRTRLLALLIREAGKTLPDAIAEVREAIDFCRYYALLARREFLPDPLPGPTGEINQLSLHGRGVFVCISPWNFPLAIFMGQVAAALVAGNSVIAKPAPQTPLIAYEAVKLLRAAGVPGDVLHLLPGGPAVGEALVTDPRIGGVAFTGSTDTARRINRHLAAKDAAIVPLIAETGGQNALIADSSSLPEQVVQDVIISAFQSAGQRCSACRILFVQSDVADKVLKMLAGAASDLILGDPGKLVTDIGPVIDGAARDRLKAHSQLIGQIGTRHFQAPLGKGTENGTFYPPEIVEIDSLGRLDREVFGPILHVIRWDASNLDKVVDAINDTGYGLTLGVHSRIDETVQRVISRARVGNIYVNRSMIGAVVGVQPFGGEGLSGTGPKAGGPRYLTRFAAERTVSIDTTSAGGNASLMSMEE